MNKQLDKTRDKKQHKPETAPTPREPAQAQRSAGPQDQRIKHYSAIGNRGVQRLMESEERETAPPLQHVKSFAGGGADESPPGRNNGVTERGSGAFHEAAAAGVRGTPRPYPHLDRIQDSFGRHNVKYIKAYTGENAAAANRSMGSRAYNAGNRVAFADSTPDLFTAAHEAAHGVQKVKVGRLQGGVGRVGDPYERHADRVANRVVSGQSAEAVLDEFTGSLLAGVSQADTAAHSPYLPGRTPIQMLDSQMKGPPTYLPSGNPSANLYLPGGGHRLAPFAGMPYSDACTTMEIITAGEKVPMGMGVGSAPPKLTDFEKYRATAKWSRVGGLVKEKNLNQAATLMHAINHRMDITLLNVPAGGGAPGPNNIFLGTQQSNNPNHLHRVETPVLNAVKHAGNDVIKYETEMNNANLYNVPIPNADTDQPMSYWKGLSPGAAGIDALAIQHGNLYPCAADNPAYSKVKVMGAKGAAHAAGAVLPAGYTELGMALALDKNTAKDNFKHTWLEYKVTPNYHGVPNYVRENIKEEISQLPAALAGIPAVKLVKALAQVPDALAEGLLSAILPLPTVDVVNILSNLANSGGTGPADAGNILIKMGNKAGGMLINLLPAADQNAIKVTNPAAITPLIAGPAPAALPAAAIPTPAVADATQIITDMTPDQAAGSLRRYGIDEASSIVSNLLGPPQWANFPALVKSLGVEPTAQIIHHLGWGAPGALNTARTIFNLLEPEYAARVIMQLPLAASADLTGFFTGSHPVEIGRIIQSYHPELAAQLLHNIGAANIAPLLDHIKPLSAAHIFQHLPTPFSAPALSAVPGGAAAAAPILEALARVSPDSAASFLAGIAGGNLPLAKDIATALTSSKAIGEIFTRIPAASSWPIINQIPPNAANAPALTKILDGFFIVNQGAVDMIAHGVGPHPFFVNAAAAANILNVLPKYLSRNILMLMPPGLPAPFMGPGMAQKIIAAWPGVPHPAIAVAAAVGGFNLPGHLPPAAPAGPALPLKAFPVGPAGNFAAAPVIPTPSPAPNPAAAVGANVPQTIQNVFTTHPDLQYGLGKLTQPNANALVAKLPGGKAGNLVKHRIQYLASFPDWAQNSFPTTFKARVNYYTASYKPNQMYYKYSEEDTYSTDL